jgi:cation:H+ antiporter
MWTELALLALGLTILLGGGELLVRSAAQLARALGVSTLTIGLTVVAFGTSAPELFVNVRAALADTGALSFGNIFGSNMANIGLIVGMTAFLSPLPIQSIVTRRELPMLLLATVAFAIMGFDTDLGGPSDTISRGDGLILLLFFIVFLYYTVGDLSRQRAQGIRDEDLSPLLAAADIPAEDDDARSHVARDVILTLVGLVALSWGASLTVDSAVALAHIFEVPEVIIGLTLVSIGTSLPELVAAIMAVRNKAVDMAVGGIVGSNIFNTLLIGGVTATIEPMEFPESAHFDLAATAVLTLALMFTSNTHRRVIIRYEGAALFVIYIAYISLRTL